LLHHQKNVFPILRPFSRHHPINFSSAEITAKVITNVSRLETMANNAVGRSTPAQSKKNIEVVLHLLSHLQIYNMGDDLFALMAERTVPTMCSASPNLPEEAYAIPHEELADTCRSTSTDLMASNAQLYLQHLTQSETAELNNFYSTTTGEKMLTVLPMLKQQNLI
jgi:hypothetical protein